MNLRDSIDRFLERHDIPESARPRMAAVIAWQLIERAGIDAVADSIVDGWLGPERKARKVA